MILFRNCLHGNDVITYLSTDFSGEKFFYKSSYTSDGIKSLRNEVEGWSWYESRLNAEENLFSKICTTDYCSNGYMRIKIKYFKGNKGEYTNGLVKNFDIIEMFIKQYLKYWSYFNDGTSFVHGDLSIDNIIVVGKDIFVIDWEHFSNQRLLWGFDALYLIFESLYFSIRHRNIPNKSELKLIIKLIRLLNKNNHISEKYISNPLSSIIQIIEENNILWGKQLTDLRMKLPILMMDKTQINNIDLLIKGELNK